MQVLGADLGWRNKNAVYVCERGVRANKQQGWHSSIQSISSEALYSSTLFPCLIHDWGPTLEEENADPKFCKI